MNITDIDDKIIKKAIESNVEFSKISREMEAEFSKTPCHHYAKLEPTNIGNEDLLAEGEGALTSADAAQEKKDKKDFALWKKIKEEKEPAWDSPWGKGRPGWHI